MLLAGRDWCLSQRRQPATDDRFGDLIDKKEVTLGSQIRLQMRQHHVMPFEGFRAMPNGAMSPEILLDCSFNRQALTFLR